MHVRIVEFAIRDYDSLAAYLGGAPHPYVIRSLSAAEDLLAQVRSMNDARGPNAYEETTRAKLRAAYGDFEKALSVLNNLLTRDDIDPIPVRRQLVWTTLAKRGSWHGSSNRSVRKMVSLLEDNLQDANYSGSDVRLWWNLLRYLSPSPSQNRVIEVVSYWREAEYSVESLFHSYVAYAVDVLDGIPSSKPHMERLMQECAGASRGLSGRVRSREWVGSGEGMGKLVHQSDLGAWDQEKGFWADPSRLIRVEGRVSEIKGPQAGSVVVAGMSAFFVPSRAGFVKGKGINSRVTGYLGFSFDGPRFWDVVPLEQS